MPANYVLLAEQTVNTSVASVTFSNIPQTGYTDLKIVVSARRTSATDYGSLTIGFNGSSSSFANRIIVGTGSAAVSSSQTTAVGPLQGTLTTASAFNSNEIYIPNYTSSTTKTYSFDGILENNATEARAIIGSGLWSATPAAITSVTLGSDLTGDFAANSTFSIYGLAALGTIPVIAPKATGGDIVQNDGTYWYHAFLSSGIFTPSQALTCDYLVIAGGGAGGSDTTGQQGGGGGGAGGYLSSVGSSGGGAAAGSALSLLAQSYGVTIGAGGGYRASGSNTSFSTVTALGGGAGAWGATMNGSSGGSGGGGSSSSSPGAGGAAASPTQGFAGGAGQGTNNYVTGAGGGAGALGGNGASANGGTAAGFGGAGKNTLSAWASATSTGVGSA
jgi:hypothetical protein